MSARRVIPSVLVRGSVAFKGPGFGEQCTRSVGSALAICRTHASRGVDELLILDIAATDEQRGPDLGMVESLAAGCFIPITVGGGVRTIDDVNRLLRAGADKVAICTAWRENEAFVEAAVDRFGAQAIVVVIEYDSPEDVGAGDVLAYPVPAFAGEIIMQSRSRESRMVGYDVQIPAHVSSLVDCPVIISGGCRNPQDMLEAMRLGIDGCAAGALFQFEDVTPRDCSRFLEKHGVRTRCS